MGWGEDGGGGEDGGISLFLLFVLISIISKCSKTSHSGTQSYNEIQHIPAVGVPVAVSKRRVYSNDIQHITLVGVPVAEFIRIIRMRFNISVAIEFMHRSMMRFSQLIPLKDVPFLQYYSSCEY
jgi:hypothetical protein